MKHAEKLSAFTWDIKLLFTNMYNWPAGCETSETMVITQHVMTSCLWDSSSCDRMAAFDTQEIRMGGHATWPLKCLSICSNVFWPLALFVGPTDFLALLSPIIVIGPACQCDASFLRSCCCSKHQFDCPNAPVFGTSGWHLKNLVGCLYFPMTHEQDIWTVQALFWLGQVLPWKFLMLCLCPTNLQRLSIKDSCNLKVFNLRSYTWILSHG